MAHSSNRIIHGIHGSIMSAHRDISIINTINNGMRGIDVLFKASAPGAFHDSGERFDPPKCHPRTRTHILNKIMNWIVGEVEWNGFIMWLYGPAGAGKSAIAQTIAELCHLRHILLASFFFSRTDSKRNNEKSLVASIAYQIALNLPESEDAIEAAVKRDPAIFHRSVEVQFITLILEPLSKLSETGFFFSTQVPYLIIIDGLDECLDRQVQEHILRAVPTALQHPYVPLMFLICSRAEHHLTLEFTSLISGGMATHLSLDDGYEQNADIERYLTDSFHKISTTHRLKTYIPTSWPSPQVLSTLVRKSSGQFIYAATVIKYISSDRHQPTRRLEIILGIQPARNDRPFAELDALYMSILSSVEDDKATIRLLGVLILVGYLHKTPRWVGGFMFLDPGEVECLLLHLASVVECVDKDTEIRMLHASFPDFLLDRSRSGKYYIDSSMMHAEIAQLCLSHIRAHNSDHCRWCLRMPEVHFCSITNYAIFQNRFHFSQAHPSADLREALLNTDYITSVIKFEREPPSFTGGIICDSLAGFLSFLKGSKFTNAEELYLHHRNIYDRIMRKRIADFPLDLGLIICLALIELYADPDWVDEWLELKCIDHFPRVEGGLVCSYSTLYFDPMQSSIGMNKSYCELLRESLNHPVYAGKFVLDGQKYALVARFFLDCCIQPSSEQNFLVYFPLYLAVELLEYINTLLSKASHSAELVARINHTTLIFDHKHIIHWICYRRDDMKEILQSLIKGIGDYLMRVVGSVPSGLHITFETEPGEGQLYYYDTHFV